MSLPNEEKYQRILNAAKKVISEKGMEKTSISDITKEAQVAQGTFYLYFPSKGALIPAIAEDLLQRMLRRIIQRAGTGSRDIRETIRIIIEETFSITDKEKRLILLCYSGLAFEESFNEWVKIYDPYYSWLENELKQAVLLGRIALAISVERAARMMVSVIEGEAEQYYLASIMGSSLSEIKDDLERFLLKAIAYQGDNKV